MKTYTLDELLAKCSPEQQASIHRRYLEMLAEIQPLADTETETHETADP